MFQTQSIHDFLWFRLTAASVCLWGMWLCVVGFHLAGEPAEKDLPAGGAAPQRDAAEGWVGAEVQVWNGATCHTKVAAYSQTSFSMIVQTWCKLCGLISCLQDGQLRKRFCSLCIFELIQRIKRIIEVVIEFKWALFFITLVLPRTSHTKIDKIMKELDEEVKFGRFSFSTFFSRVDSWY